MKIQELRIGNLINQHGQITKVYHLDIGGKSFYRINDMPIHKETFRHRDTHELVYTPLPLTEEWLINFGFKKDSDIAFHIHSNNNHIIYIYFEEMRDCFAMIYNGSQFCTIQYVHQLQNLYYALTCTELVLGEA